MLIESKKLCLLQFWYCDFKILYFVSTSFFGGLWSGRHAMHQQDVHRPFLSIYILLLHTKFNYRLITIHVRSRNNAPLLIYRNAIDIAVQDIFHQRFALQTEDIDVLPAVYFFSFGLP